MCVQESLLLDADVSVLGVFILLVQPLHCAHGAFLLYGAALDIGTVENTHVVACFMFAEGLETLLGGTDARRVAVNGRTEPGLEGCLDSVLVVFPLAFGLGCAVLHSGQQRLGSFGTFVWLLLEF